MYSIADLIFLFNTYVRFQDSTAVFFGLYFAFHFSLKSYLEELFKIYSSL